MRTLLKTVLIVLTLAFVIGLLGACGGTTGLAVGWDYQDMDGDGIRNGIDGDVDGDGVANQHDIYPLNPYYW